MLGATLGGFARRSGLATAAAALVAGPALLGPTPANAGTNTFVEVTPNTAQAGTRVDIRASCDNANNQQANVQSDAFGRVVVRPNNGFLTGSVTIPGNKQPGAFGVTLTCQNGSTASTTLTVVNMSQGSQGPATGGGGTAGGLTGTVVLAGGIGVLTLGAGLALAGLRRRQAALPR